MKALPSIVCWTVLALAAASVILPASAQEADPNKITPQDKKVFKDVADMVDQQKLKVRQTLAVMNARQIGLALFEFETEYGAYPNDKTAADVKKATGTTAELKAVTANDCFFQLIAANIAQTDSMFSLDDPAAPARPEKQKPLEKLAKCSFAYLSGMDSAGNPGRPVVVAPLLKGKTTFDPQVFGGRAVILKVDNSVTTVPIEPDGRVLIDGKDIFDPAHPLWGGKIPSVKWPE